MLECATEWVQAKPTELIVPFALPETIHSRVEHWSRDVDIHVWVELILPTRVALCNQCLEPMFHRCSMIDNVQMHAKDKVRLGAVRRAWNLKYYLSEPSCFITIRRLSVEEADIYSPLVLATIESETYFLLRELQDPTRAKSRGTFMVFVSSRLVKVKILWNSGQFDVVGRILEPWTRAKWVLLHHLARSIFR